MQQLLRFSALALLLAGGLISCGQDNAVPADQDWIEVPLADNTFSEGSVPFRRATYNVYVGAYSALEYKLDMREGDTVVYEWTVDMDDPSLLEVEFHGHTERPDDAPGTLMFYKIHKDGRESGALKAPFSGIHGWYLNNTSNQDIQVVLTVAGFYNEVAD